MTLLSGLRTVVLSCVFCIVTLPLCAQSSEELVNSAWKVLQESNYRRAEEMFKQAIEKDAKNARAYLGLSYYYSMQRRYDAAWREYSKALDVVDTPYPYIYSMMATPIGSVGINSPSTLKDLYSSLTTKADSLGILRAMAYERLAGMAAAKGDLSTMKDYYAKVNAIDQWALIGPFENPCGSGLNKVYEPEKEINRTASYEGRYGAPAQWFVPPTQRYDKWVDFQRFFVTTSAVFYANTYIYSPRKQSVSFRIGTSGAFKAFLNDEVMLQSDDEFNNDLDTYICTTELQSGWNKVLMKCASWDINRCNFMLRIVDEAGNPIEGLKSSTDVQSYSAKPGAPVKLHANPFEQYFEGKVKQYPERLEYYLLLSDSYLRNDKGEQGEIVLRNALRQAPRCVVILENIMEAYIRNDKRDEITTTLEQLSTIDSTALSALDYKYNEALSNKNFEEAERLFSLIEQYSPQEEKIIQDKIRLMSARSNPQILELLKEAYEKYPMNEDFVTSMALLQVRARRDYDAAISIWKKYLDKNYTIDALINIADLYLQKGDYSKWEDYTDKVLEYANYATGYYYRIANEYKKRELYDKAETMIRKVLQYCPGSSQYYDFLGETARKRGDDAKAKEYYREALRRYPGDPDTRQILRELEGKKPIWSNFSTYNIDSLIKSAPKTTDYPDDESIVLLDDAKYVIYPEGSYEIKREMLVRVLKQEGVDDWKEQNLGRYATIEKAVAIKPGGSEVRADENDGYLVFKTLQEGDFVYIRYREYAAESGRFMKHFWHKEFFSGRLPTRISRLSILAPPDYKLNYRANNMSAEPEKRSTEDGVIREWKMMNTEGVKKEAAMPNWEDIGTFVEISSLDSWSYVADWYTELTNNRSKATYEIKEKVQDLLGDKSKLSEDDIIRRVYQFITDSIRYSFVSFRQSGYIPQKARDVLINKIGDCKDVATLGISMLGEAGISADYVLVNTYTSLTTKQLPSRSFDHVIIRVNSKKGVKYLDLTASNYPVGSVPQGDVESFSLLIKPGSDAGHLQRANFLPSTIHLQASATLNESGDISISREVRYKGGLSASVRRVFRDKGKKESEKNITESLSRTFPNVKLRSLDVTNLDTLTQEVSIKEAFDAPKFLSEVGSFKILKLPWLTSNELDEAFSYEERKFQLEFDPGYDTSYEEISCVLPPGYAPVELKPQVKLSSALADYTINYAFNNGTLTAKRSFVIRKRLLEVSEYKAIKEFYNSVVKEDTQQVLIAKGLPQQPSAPASGGKKKK